MVALIGEDPVVDGVLKQLLGGIGYRAVTLAASAAGADGSLDGVHLLLLAPGLRVEVREAALISLAAAPDTASIPVLELISDLTEAREVRGQIVPWPCRTEELERRIESALLDQTLRDSSFPRPGNSTRPPDSNARSR